MNSLPYMMKTNLKYISIEYKIARNFITSFSASDALSSRVVWIIRAITNDEVSPQNSTFRYHNIFIRFPVAISRRSVRSFHENGCMQVQLPAFTHLRRSDLAELLSLLFPV